MTPGLVVEMKQRWLAAILGRPSRLASLRRELEALDGPALRDLGLCRSELASFQAEAQGLAPSTRLRCATLTPSVHGNTE
jgi:hypothetical protein